ncbi:MAG: response regulator [Kofleriaceae bacterium]|nr:response regulator [Kofleriaceae bacterium]
MEPKVVIVGATPEQYGQLRTALGDFYYQFVLPDERDAVMLVVGDWQAQVTEQPDTPKIALSKDPNSRTITEAMAKGELEGACQLTPTSDELRALCQRVCRRNSQMGKITREAVRGRTARTVASKLWQWGLQLGQLESRRELLENCCKFACEISECSISAIICKPTQGSNDEVPHIHLFTLGSNSSAVSLLNVEAHCARAFTENLGPDATIRAVPSTMLGQVIEVPIVDADGVFALLVLCSQSTFSLDDEIANILSLVALRIGGELTRFRYSQVPDRQRLELMVDSMADGLLMTEIDRKEIIINPAARRLLGIPGSVVVTQSYLKDSLGFYPFDLVAEDPDAHELLREELSIGDKRLHSMVSPVRDRSGRLVGVVVVLRDFTEARALVHRQEEFIEIVSHEFRTPLTSISGSLDIALSDYAGSLSDKQRQYLMIAKDACMSLNRIVDDLLDVARSDELSLSLHWGPVDLEQLAQKATQRYRSVAESKDITLSLTSGASSTLIRGDSSRLLQVLNNLLSNALKFTPYHGEVRVEVFGRSVSSSLVGVSVYNNGIPIAEEARERIFDKFEKGTGSATRRVGGTGLGLAISRSIVEAHGGRIWAESNDEGAQFVFTLPSGAADADTSASIPSESTPTVPSKILLVDADTNSSYLLKGILMSVGHQVVVARDADTALLSAQKHHPSLIIVHVAASSITSSIAEPASLLEILKHHPDTRKISVLIVSAEPLDPSLDSIVLHRLTLPVEPETFNRECARLLRESKLADGNRVLVVDDDPSIRSICAEVLRSADLTVREVSNGQEALEAIKTFRPDVILLDVMMPIMDGFETAEKIKADQTSAMIPIIFLSARGETNDKVKAFHIGAEDYVVKPFVTEELIARVRKAMTRSHRDLGASPTTELPGGNAIAAEIERRLGNPDAVFCYLDLDNLKAYNDHYSYAKADGIIRQTGDLIRNVISSLGGPEDFIGHIAGDDFVFITSRQHVDHIGVALCTSFDRLVPLYYDKDDRDRGYIETNDRYGELRKFPLMSVSIAAVTSLNASLTSYSELAAAAARGKKQAKAIVGSCYLKDGITICPA